MTFMALIQTDEHDWMAVSETAAKAKQAVFDGFNTNLMQGFEREENFRIETTVEYLEGRLAKYYKEVFGGSLHVDTLEKALGLEVFELIPNQCYRNGYRVPRRVQDIKESIWMTRDS